MIRSNGLWLNDIIALKRVFAVDIFVRGQKPKISLHFKKCLLLCTNGCEMSAI